MRAARIDAAGEAEQFGPAQQVVRQRGDHRPGRVGVEVAGGEVRERLVFEVADDELDDGVLAVLGLDDVERVGAVGGEREVAPSWAAARPGRRACGRGGRSGAGRRAWSRRSARCWSAGSRPASARRPRGICSIAARTWAAGARRSSSSSPPAASRAKILFDQKPESARSSFGPVAPARSTRAISSSTKRSIPREVFAEPLRSRMCSTSPVSARGGEDRVIAALARVAERRALLGVAVDLADEAVDVDDQAPVARAGAGVPRARRAPRRAAGRAGARART